MAWAGGRYSHTGDEDLNQHATKERLGRVLHDACRNATALGGKRAGKEGKGREVVGREVDGKLEEACQGAG